MREPRPYEDTRSIYAKQVQTEDAKRPEIRTLREIAGDLTPPTLKFTRDVAVVALGGIIALLMFDWLQAVRLSSVIDQLSFKRHTFEPLDLPRGRIDDLQPKADELMRAMDRARDTALRKFAPRADPTPQRELHIPNPK